VIHRAAFFIMSVTQEMDRFTCCNHYTSRLLFCHALTENPSAHNVKCAYWTDGNVNYGNYACEKLSLDILAEQEAIVGYEEVLRNLRGIGGSGAQEVEWVIRRILEDEEFHLKLFKEAYEHCCK
jgi:hypothetical protein